VLEKQWLERARAQALNRIGKIEPFAPLLVRLTLGGVFASSGWGKLNNLQQVTEFFTELGIVAPGLNAVFVSSTELICGVLLLLGWLTRLSSLPLMGVMTVALLTAKASELEGPLELLGSLEFGYLVMLFVLLCRGAGKFSLDAVTWKTHSAPAALAAPATPH
jgi:putative oxidoreductase